jgi:outer membrane protein assembly factor BamB
MEHMSETAPQQRPEDEQVIITDLDPQHLSPSPGSRGSVARLARSHLAPAFFRWSRICLVLLAGLLLASVLFQPPSFIASPATSTGTQPPSLSANAGPAIVDMSVNNGSVYMITSGGAIAAYRASDGLLLWRQILAGGLTISVIATNQAVYCLQMKGVYGRVVALYPGNGMIAWAQKISIVGAAHMLLAGGIIFLYSSRGMLYAVSDESGRILWSAPILVGQPPDEFVSLEDGYVTIVSPQLDDTILRASDGKLIYRVNSSLITPQSTRYPTIQHGIIYISYPSSVQARSINNGALLWKYSYTALSWYPVIQDGIVFARGTGSALLAFRGQDGTLLWKYTTNAPTIFPVISNGTVYLQLPGNQAIALRESDGATLWRSKLPLPAYPNISDPNPSVPPLVDNGTLFLNALLPFSTVYALRASDGYLIWYHELSDTMFKYPPQTGGGIIYLDREDYTINAFSESTGQLLWSFSTTVPLIWSPAIDDGSMFVRTIDNALYVLNVSDGKQLWHYAANG